MIVNSKFFFLQKEVLEWEKKFLDVCEEGIPGLDIYYFTIRSYEDLVGGAIQDGLQFLIIGYILMITYFTVALGRINCRDSKVRSCSYNSAVSL